MQESANTKKFLILCTTVFLGFLTIGLPLAVLPGQIRDLLGFSALIVGFVIGIQSFATVMTRHIAGSNADRVGAKPTVRMGLCMGAASGLIYFLSSRFQDQHFFSLGLLVVGRLFLGLGESLLITGALTWGIGLMGIQKSGKVMAWNGIAMYGALSIGAPIGLFIARYFHFSGVAVGACVAPLLGVWLTRFIPSVHEKNVLAEKVPFFKTVQSIWKYGLGMALGTLGFGALSTFIVLYFSAKGWGNAGVALLIFGASYIGVRLVAGHLPDKIGGRTIAIVSLFVEAVGQGLIWIAPNLFCAYAGVALTGFGFSLVFPAFGVQAMKRISANNRGAALGAFFAFFDISLGCTGPLSGAVASLFGYPAIYLMGMIAALGATAIAVIGGDTK